jgi:hypothetical protein
MANTLNSFAANFNKFNVTHVHLAITCIGGFIVVVRIYHLFPSFSPLTRISFTVWHVLFVLERKGPSSYKTYRLSSHSFQLYIGEACWAFLFGVIIGPYGLALFNPRSWVNTDSSLIDSQSLNAITIAFTRIVLAIGVFAVGVELPKQYMKKHWRSIFILLVPVMTWVIIPNPITLSTCPYNF